MDSLSAKAILSRMGLPQKKINDLYGISSVKKVTAGEYFVSEGQVPKKFAVVLSGLFRYFYIHDNGDEFTKGFILPGSVLASYSAMLHQAPPMFFVQALEKADILEVNYRSWLSLQQTNPFYDFFIPEPG